MKHLLVCTLLALVTAQEVIGTACHTDSECLSFCCDNNQDYSVEGKCTEVVDDTRCQ